MINFELLHPRATQKSLGLIPFFFSEENPLSASQQVDENYSYGGWNPVKGFKMHEGSALKFPGDPLMRPIARAKFRDETIYIYQYAWVAIVQPDGQFEVSRID